MAAPLQGSVIERQAESVAPLGSYRPNRDPDRNTPAPAAMEAVARPALPRATTGMLPGNAEAEEPELWHPGPLIGAGVMLIVAGIIASGFLSILLTAIFLSLGGMPR